MDEYLGQKMCVTCHVVRPLSDFNRLTKAPDGRQPRCRPCCQQWYRENRVQHMINARARTIRQRASLTIDLNRYLLENPCVDCGESDLRVLEFDHRDPAAKSKNIGTMFADAYPWKTILLEIAKCDVRCANCHRRRTSGDFSWWRTPAEAARREAVTVSASARLLALFAGSGAAHPVA